MKRKLTYWNAIGLFSIAMTGAALGYLSGTQQVVSAGRSARVGVCGLFGITMIAAVISHLASGDSIGMALNESRMGEMATELTVGN